LVLITLDDIFIRHLFVVRPADLHVGNGTITFFVKEFEAQRALLRSRV
jgi:hypothetical protein